MLRYPINVGFQEAVARIAIRRSRSVKGRKRKCFEFSLSGCYAQEVGFAKSLHLPEADIGADCREVSLGAHSDKCGETYER